MENNSMDEITLTISSLPKTWFIDLDGTIVKHNGYLLDGHDTLLNGALDFLNTIPAEDIVIITTSRTDECISDTELFLKKNGVRYDQIIYGLPYGERILINDNKNSGLKTAYSVNIKRNTFPNLTIKIDDKL